MLKKTITFTDYNGQERTEDFYFNLTKAECAEMELSQNGGVSKMLTKIVAEQDQKKLIEIWKGLIIQAYGEKSNDGRRFMKSKEISDSFTQTEAFSILFMELVSNTNAATALVNGIIPQIETKSTATVGIPIQHN